MKKIISLLVVCITLLSVSIIPAYAEDIETNNGISTYAGTVERRTFPQTYSSKTQAYLRESMLKDVDYFTITVQSNQELGSYRVIFLDDMDYEYPYENFKAGAICKLSYNSYKQKIGSVFGGDIFYIKIIAFTSTGATTTDFSYTIDVEEKSSIMLGIIDYLKGAFNDFQDFFAGLFQGIFDFIDSIKELWDAKDNFLDRFNNSISTAWSIVESYTLDPVIEFFNTLSTGAIGIWLSFFNFPIIKELAVALVTVSLVSGIFTLFVTI